ncbi:hypothetical protein NC796_08360 [Aliifodinibius sp. S!AR15-10]|uniref:hypothetical protein n=1 Tax=Aliifodinibius sp. S!AR15-10 TaxID=2950437 RepID=UPI00285B4616|nr:hypothetical protein [Aliifodinibius sp. S!AR15-10]MDR8391146.1 hypothetical protein [Aliifodinibius sp. S!AR15-10]
MGTKEINWDENLLFIGNDIKVNNSIDEERRNEIRKEIEPWLSAIFQSEQFSLLVGSGLSNALAKIADIDSQDMSRLEFEGEYSQEIKAYAEKTAEEFGRGTPNFEDDLRASLELLRGYQIQDITASDNDSSENEDGEEEKI